MLVRTNGFRSTDEPREVASSINEAGLFLSLSLRWRGTELNGVAEAAFLRSTSVALGKERISTVWK